MSLIDELEADVRALATPAGREVGTPGHAAAREFLVARMRALGLEAYAGEDLQLHYRGRFTNLLGRRRGTTPGLDPVLLAAHYDTCGPLPGADDNAAALAIALATAAELARAPLTRDVVFAFFDAEEPPHFHEPEMGSNHFYAHQRRERIHFALVLDLVGHDVPIAGLEDLLVATGLESDPELPALVQAVAAEADLRFIATLNRYVGDMSDHGAFRRDRRPYLFLSCGHWPHYHEPTDTPEKLNYAKMARVQRVVTRLLRGAASAELAGPFEGFDTTATELALLARALGPYLRRAGIPLADRADIDALVRGLRRAGL